MNQLDHFPLILSIRTFILSLLLSWGYLGITTAQPFVRETNTIPVTVNSVQLALPFQGGINAPNLQFFDTDTDNDLDLFVYDQDLTLDYYKNAGTKFNPNFQLANGQVTLPDFSTWYLFPDLNGDGLQDFLCDDGASGVRYYIQTGKAKTPNFALVDSSMKDDSGQVILGGLNSIPAFADIDHDGDLDFFSVNSAGGTLNFYRNTGTAQSPTFHYVTDFWQHIQILGGKSAQTNNILQKEAFRLRVPGEGNQPQKHGAASLRFCDIDNDGDNDLFYGDLFSFSMYFFQNVNDSMVQVTNRYPRGDSIYSFGFNAPVLADIDADSDFDLFIGGMHPGTSMHSFTLFRNDGTVSSPNFTRVTNDYLQMIDIGKSSHPAFCDIDNDGDQDLVIGSTDKGVSLYRNIGTQTEPHYELADTNLGNVHGNYDYAPKFVDIDGDGDIDMFIGNFSGKLQFYQNVGSPASPSFVLTVNPNSDSIHVSQDMAAAFVDIDGDGDYDLFVGKPNGTLIFYRNQGNAASFLPVLESVPFQNITDGQFVKPFFVDADGDGDYDLFTGSSEGVVGYYENIGTPQTAQFVRRTNHYANTDKASEVDPVLADIDHDGDLDLFLGNYHGGIMFYRNLKNNTSVTEQNRTPHQYSLAQNYPNPFNPTTTIAFTILESRHSASLRIFDILGKEVATLIEQSLPAGTYTVEWNAANIPSGLYFYQLTTGGLTETKKMVLMK